mmetsp:Transcript_21595/g.42942  ORF Transcript_21595/g.42942 Transcript_21595/m.42942 type:complete len:125 (+) Transcript_21595:376-750(+)
MTSRLAGKQRQLFSLTQSAAGRIKQLMAAKVSKGAESLFGVKVGLKRRGCNGLSYTMNYVTESQIGRLDEVIKDQEVTVVVDANAVMYLAGTQMDYVTDALGSEFVFNNPNKKSECGCGQSFNV